MAAFQDLTGQRFGYLVVVERDGKDRHGKWHWLCRCTYRGCESTTVVSGGDLRRRRAITCGCSMGRRADEPGSYVRAEVDEMVRRIGVRS